MPYLAAVHLDNDGAVSPNKCFPTPGRGALTPPAKSDRIRSKNPVGLWEHTQTELEEFSAHARGVHAGLQRQ